MSYGQSLTSTLPTVGVTAGNTAATMINSYLDELRQVVEAKVTPAGINVNADLSFSSAGTSYSVLDAKKAAFARQTSLLSAASNPMSMFFGSTDGDLYVNDNAGRQIQITTGGTINASTTGGITGAGYGAGGVAVNWNAGTNYYELFDGASSYAGIYADKVRITNGTASVIINDVGAGTDYTLTLPTAVPASTSLVLMANSGALSTTLTPSITTLTTSGLITAGGGVTASANQHLTVSGTGRFKHGDFITYIDGMDFKGDGDQSTVSVRCLSASSASHGVQLSATADVLICGLRLPVGSRIQSLGFRLQTSNDASTRTCALYRYDVSTQTRTLIASSTTTTVNAQVLVTLAAIAHTVINANTYFLRFSNTAATSDAINGVEMVHDWP